MCKKVGSESSAFFPKLPQTNEASSAQGATEAPSAAPPGSPLSCFGGDQQVGAFGFINLSLSFAFGLGAVPPSGCIPGPSPEMSCAPSGRGLTKNSDGSITTAGGYRIVPEGKKAAWTIYGPDGGKLTSVSGDPHVKEADGTKWDFTKSSNFVLPDGTRIAAKTGKVNPNAPGQTVTTGLDIANGSDRVRIDGINKKPVTGEITHDGLDGWTQANGQGHDTFELHHDSSHQNWVKHTADGRLAGVVTGAFQKTKGGAYYQKTNGKDSTLPGGQPADVAGANGANGADGGAPLAGDPTAPASPFDPQSLARLFGSPESLMQAFAALRALLFGAIGDRGLLESGFTPRAVRA